MKLTNLNDNIIYNSLKDAEIETQNAREVPPGYMEVRLSTKGKLGAPSLLHVRNFKVSDIVALSMTSDRDIAARLIEILNEMIFEDVDVSTWHEKEVEELMVYIFKTFYKNVLDDVDFPLNDEDYEYLKSTDKYEDVKSGKWTPKTTIVIDRDVDIYDIPNDFDSKITITNKKTGFSCTFDYIKYGDQLVIKKWLDSYYAEQENRFRVLKSQIQINNNLLGQVKDDPEVVNKFIPYDPEEEKAYSDYMTERLKTLSEIVRIISITNYNGMDVSNLSVGDKYELIKDDARIDYGMISKLNKRQQKLKFGLNPEVSMRNPLTGEVVKRPYSFRLTTILQAMQVSGLDDYDDGYDDED